HGIICHYCSKGARTHDLMLVKARKQPCRTLLGPDSWSPAVCGGSSRQREVVILIVHLADVRPSTCPEPGGEQILRQALDVAVEHEHIHPVHIAMAEAALHRCVGCRCGCISTNTVGMEELPANHDVVRLANRVCIQYQRRIDEISLVRGVLDLAEADP